MLLYTLLTTLIEANDMILYTGISVVVCSVVFYYFVLLSCLLQRKRSWVCMSTAFHYHSR